MKKFCGAHSVCGTFFVSVLTSPTGFCGRRAQVCIHHPQVLVDSIEFCMKPFGGVAKRNTLIAWRDPFEALGKQDDKIR